MTNSSQCLLFTKILITPFIILLCSNNTLAHEWMAPKADAFKKNPVEANMLSVSRGKTNYMRECAYCHGPEAKGLPIEKTGLSTNAPNLVNRLKSHSSGDIYWKIENGKEDMPSFKDVLSEEQLWDVINYIKSIEN